MPRDLLSHGRDADQDDEAGRWDARRAGTEEAWPAAYLAGAPHETARRETGVRGPSSGRRWWVVLAGVAAVVGAMFVLRDGVTQLQAPRVAKSASPTSAFDPLTGANLIAETDRGVVWLPRTTPGAPRRRLPDPPGGPRLTLAGGGWATYDAAVVIQVTAAGRSALVVDSDGDTRQLGPAAEILRGARGRSLWLIGRGVTGVTATETLLDGRTVDTFAVPTGHTPAAVLRSGMLLRRDADGAYGLWSPGQADVRALGRPGSPVTGRLVGAGAEHLVLGDDCAAGGLCRFTVVNLSRVTPSSATVPVAPSSVTVPAPLTPLGPPVVSRDGRWLAMVVDPDSGDGQPQTALAVGTVAWAGDDLAVIGGTRGVVGGEPAVAAPEWSFNGRVFMVGPGTGGRVFAFRPGEKAARPVPLPGLIRIDGIRVA